ncbi:MAG: hypothetical protein ACI8SE_001388 [Bacteroidia bacterium]
MDNIPVFLWNRLIYPCNRNIHLTILYSALLVQRLIYLCLQSDTMRKYILIWLLLASANITFAQIEYHFSGFITSNETGRPQSNVRISVSSDSVETTTNAAGFFNLILSVDSFEAFLEKSGFEETKLKVTIRDVKSSLIMPLTDMSRGAPKTKKITANEAGLFDIPLKPFFNTEYTHYTPSSFTDLIIADVESDKIVMDRSELDAIPFIFSEPDVSKALQIHPGVDFATDGYSDMTVRGGGLGQNQILLDGTPVYGLGHFEGYISNFSSNMTEEVVLYKAAFPARYGGRLSSVMDVKSSAGNAEDATVNMAISPVLGNFNIGLPLGNGNAIGVSFRRSYIDLLFQVPDQQLFFRDFNTKLDLNLNDKNKLTLSYFSLKDKIQLSGSEFNDSMPNVKELDFSFDVTLKNQTASGNWLHIFDKKTTANFSAYYTNYSNGIVLKETDYTAPIGSNAISDYTVRFSAGEIGAQADIEHRKNKKMLLRYGLQNRLHLNNSGSLVDKRYTIDGDLITDDQYGDTVIQMGIETSLYIEDEYRYSDKLSFNAGLRATLYSYHDFTRVYPEPRFSGRYLLSKSASLKFSYARMHQFMHLYNTDGVATDNFVVYLPAGEKLKPQSSDIISFGYHSRPNKRLRFSSEAYYKLLGNQPIFYAADLFDRGDMEANSLVGTGVVVGLENSIKYIGDNMMFWASATFSNATRKYDELNRGESFSFDYDRRVIGKIGYIMNLDNFVFSVIGVGATGNPFTLPTSKYRDIDGGVVLAYDEINNYRSTHHARIDAKFEWHFSDEVQSIELMVYNLLGTRNIQSIYSERDTSTTTYKYTAFTNSSYPFFPFITYRVKI